MKKEKNALDSQPTNERNRHFPNSFCESCLCPFQITEEIRAVVSGTESNGAHQIWDDANGNFKLFMGHTLRIFIQGEAVRELWDLIDAA